ncbi:MAG: DUF3473 domain-containing protein [Bryobacterales bacterium]|nr:DUF3473 domain-containing protein [Bryobacterales bacterium]
MLNILSVDVEDYFHPSEVQHTVDPQCWSGLESRIDVGVHRILELLQQHNVRATFFVLGWIAKHHPEIVREIATAGHEIGCHSYAHQLVYQLSPDQFKEDLQRAKTAIEDACGFSPRVYRAPSYSITQQSIWALEILAEQGFTHDSSIYPVFHDRYGIPGFCRNATIIQTRSGPILEVPIATVRLAGGHVAPVGGGAYLRLLPYRYTAAGIRRLNRTEKIAACIYFHPWELDPDQPRLASGFISNVRTYHGLQSMTGKIERLLSDFQFSTLTAVHPVPALEPVEHCALASSARAQEYTAPQGRALHAQA